MKLNNHIAWISLGSNISAEQNIQKAMQSLKDIDRHCQFSSIWETPPVGSQGPFFLNAAVKLNTSLPTPEALKFDLFRPLEEKMGRLRSTDKFAPRTIDIDVLIFDEILVEPLLFKFPHLYIPMAEIFPNFIIPGSRNRLIDLYFSYFSQNQRPEIKKWSGKQDM